MKMKLKKPKKPKKNSRKKLNKKFKEGYNSIKFLKDQF